MPRPPANMNIARLLESMPEPLCILDIACACRVGRTSIYYYTTGRKPCPHVERKMANFFHLSVPQLRAELGLDADGSRADEIPDARRTRGERTTTQPNRRKKR